MSKISEKEPLVNVGDGDWKERTDEREQGMEGTES
jgi:hypothetical protein